MERVHRILMDLFYQANNQHRRGILLLKENLSSAQRAQYEKRGYFDVVGRETGRRYRIRYGAQMNVHLLDTKGRPVCWLCFMPEGEIVVGDIMLAQKLAVELFESQTLKVANTFSTNHPIGPISGIHGRSGLRLVVRPLADALPPE
jgi:hypothetical protein